MMSLKKKLVGEIKIVVAKNTLAKRALNGLKNIEPFLKMLEGQNALIFTDMNPFKLSLMLEKSKVYLPARGGDVATDPILIPAGNTGIPPGPVLSEFKEAGVPTRIDAGSIWVTKDTVVRQKGEVISPKLAGLLSKLGIKPIKAGLSIAAAYTDGLVLYEDDLRIDLDEYAGLVASSFSGALALAVEVGYTTKESLPLIISRAVRQSFAVAVSAGYPADKETTTRIVADMHLRALALYEELKKRGYS